MRQLVVDVCVLGCVLVCLGVLTETCRATDGCRPALSGRQALPIGSACQGSADCGSGRFSCATDHPDGYCVAACRADGDCPADSVCVGASVLYPGECHVRCDRAATACRSSYVCVKAGSDASHDYCDPPGSRALERRVRARAWR